MKVLSLAILSVLLLATFSAAEKSYNGYQVLRTSRLTESQAKLLRGYEDVLDFWKSASPNKMADIMVAPDQKKSTLRLLKSAGIDFDVMVEDVQALSELSRPRISPSPQFDWVDYHSYDEIMAFLDEVAAANDYADVVSIGNTYEGRDMHVLRFTKAGAGKPNVWVEAGIHAREWIAPAVATYLIDQLVNRHNDGSLTKYIDNLNIHFLPSANPDGYEYTRTDERMWRKTRSINGGTCIGTDPNRNFDEHWCQVGASNVTCSDIYCGPSAFSEIETQNIRDYHRSLDPKPWLSHCIHSYGQEWLYPYCYADGAVQPNVDDAVALATAATNALTAVHGTEFTVIPGYELYPHSGTAMDWYAAEGSYYSYVSELRDQGRYGFILPPDQIIESGEEMWEAFKVMLDQVMADNP